MMQVLSEVARPIELGGVKVSDAGGIAQCEPKLPMSFGFAWRDMNFTGEIARGGEKLVLRLSADIATVPFSAENTGRRQQLLALLQASGSDSRQVSLVLSPNNALVLLREIELPRESGLTAHTLVTQTATTVLESAPYLDLMAEYGISQTATARRAAS